MTALSINGLYRDRARNIVMMILASISLPPLAFGRELNTTPPEAFRTVHIEIVDWKGTPVPGAILDVAGKFDLDDSGFSQEPLFSGRVDESGRIEIQTKGELKGLTFQAAACLDGARFEISGQVELRAHSKPVVVALEREGIGHCNPQSVAYQLGRWGFDCAATGRPISCKSEYLQRRHNRLPPIVIPSALGHRLTLHIKDSAGGPVENAEVTAWQVDIDGRKKVDLPTSNGPEKGLVTLPVELQASVSLVVNRCADGKLLAMRTADLKRRLELEWSEEAEVEWKALTWEQLKRTPAMTITLRDSEDSWGRCKRS